MWRPRKILCNKPIAVWVSCCRTIKREIRRNFVETSGNLRIARNVYTTFSSMRTTTAAFPFPPPSHSLRAKTEIDFFCVKKINNAVMFTKVELKIVQNWRKIPVGGIVALNFGPILNRRWDVGVDSAGSVFILTHRIFHIPKRFHGEREEKRKDLSRDWHKQLISHSTNPHPLLLLFINSAQKELWLMMLDALWLSLIFFFSFVTRHNFHDFSAHQTYEMMEENSLALLHFH